MNLKPGIRTVGIDDGPFSRSHRGDILAVGAVYRGGTWFDGLVTTRVRKDGFNATDRLTSMLIASKFLDQLHYVMLDGIALGGFNIVDIQRLREATGLKVIAVMRRPPDFASIFRALDNLSRPNARKKLIEKAGPVLSAGKIYCQIAGLDIDEARAAIELTSTRSLLPEPVRAAHLIAGGLVTGQSGRSA